MNNNYYKMTIYTINSRITTKITKTTISNGINNNKKLHLLLKTKTTMDRIHNSKKKNYYEKLK